MSVLRDLFVALLLACGAVAPAAAIELATTCPPGFGKSAAGTCELHTLYDFYTSLQGGGVGGLKTALPPARDGFSPGQIDLGRHLFFDPLLSGTRTLSCASCHDPALGFSDARPRSLGAGGADVGRAAPTLWNVAFLRSFFWDARAHTLEAQMQGPLYSAAEMANTPARLLADINANASYRRLFAQAFARDAATAVTLEEIYTAITAFETSLVSLNSRYDRYAHGFHAALSPREIEGMNIFRSFVARCAECHTPPLFTNQQVAVTGTPEPPGRALDVGAETTFGAPRLKGGFKVPTLRNITRTAPYMHSGVFADLRAATQFYNDGRGHAVPKGVEMHIHWHIWEPKLRPDEIDRLVDFMAALEDESFLPAVPAAVPSGLPVTRALADTDTTTQAEKNP